MPQFRSQDYSAFALGLMAVLLIKIIYYPSLTLHPQIWEEGATNFFFTAHHQGLIKNLIQYDAGYLPWFPRLVAVVTELARIPVAWVPAVYQWTAIIFIASSSAILALPHFRGVVRSDWIRLAIVLALGFFEEYQSHVFINFAYFGVIPLFIVVSHPAIVTNLGPWILPILFLTVCSKGVFIPFLIPSALLALYHHGRGRWMERRFFLWLTGGLLIQLGYSLALALYSHTHSMGNGSHGMGLLKSLWSAFSHLISAAGNTLFGRIYSPGHRISALLSSLAILAAIAMSWRRKRWDDLWLVLTGLTLVFGVNLLVSLKIGEWFDIAVGYFPPEGIFGRWGILPNAMVFLTIAILLARRMVTLGRAGNALFVAWLFAGGVFFPRLPTARNLSWPSVGYDAWSTLSSTIDRERPYCVPVNPYPTIVNRGCNYLEPPAFPNRFGTRQAIWPEVGILSPEKFSNQEVMLIGLPLFAPTDSSTRLEAFDREGHTLASATSSQTTGGQFTFFRFTSPLRGIHRLRLSSRQPVATLDDGTPAWVFLGVKSEKSPAGYYHQTP